MGGGFKIYRIKIENIDKSSIFSYPIPKFSASRKPNNSAKVIKNINIATNK